MSDGARERIIALRNKADRKLQAARKVLAVGLADDAVSRAYYAMYHAALALLATVHERPKTHKGVLMRFHSAFVETGRFSRDLYQAFAAAKEAREYGDYETGEPMTDATAATTIDQTERFLAEVDRLL